MCVDLNRMPHAIANSCVLRGHILCMSPNQTWNSVLWRTWVNARTPPPHPSPRFSRKIQSERNSESQSERWHHLSSTRGWSRGTHPHGMATGNPAHHLNLISISLPQSYKHVEAGNESARAHSSASQWHVPGTCMDEVEAQEGGCPESHDQHQTYEP